MPTKLSEKAVEGSTFGIVFAFAEKVDGELFPYTPNSGLTWSLKDKHGAPVNNQTDKPLTPLAPSITLVLIGADLALAGGPTDRYVTIEGTYDGVLGTDLPLVDEVSFQIENLIGQP